jgi:hypothetical protein
MISVALLLIHTAAGAFLVWFGQIWVKVAGYQKQLDAQLDQQGVDTDAEIVNNRFETSSRGRSNYYVSYQFMVQQPDDQPRKFTNEYAVSSADYQWLKLGDQIQVRYLPTDPKTSRPGSGIRGAYTSRTTRLNGLMCIFTGVALIIFGIILSAGQAIAESNSAASATAYLLRLSATPNPAQKTATVQSATATAQIDRSAVTTIRAALAPRLADWKKVDDRMMHRVLPPETDLNLGEVEIDYGYCANGSFYLYVWLRRTGRLDLKYEINTFFDGYGYVEGSTPPKCYPSELSQVWLRNGGALEGDWYAVSGATTLKVPKK